MTQVFMKLSMKIYHRLQNKLDHLLKYRQPLNKCLNEKKTRESRLRKKSLKSGYEYWDTSIQNDESLNPETTEAQAPPIAVGPVTGYSSVYPQFATPTLVQPQLHYNPNIATVAYTPAKQ